MDLVAPPVIRRIRPDETLQFREIRLAALADAPSAFGSTHGEEVLRPMAFWADRVQQAALSELTCTFVAEADAQWLGLVGGYRDDVAADVVELVSMWVAPEARRLGLGERLVAAVLGWARAHDAAEVQLWVTTTNAAAKHLYERVGFEADGEYQPVPSDPCRNESRMRQRLS